jgi:hypothetical protein
MPSPAPELHSIVGRYLTAVGRLRHQLEVFLLLTWDSLADHRDDSIDAFSRRVAPVVTGGQRHIASLTDLYLAQLATLLLAEPFRPIGIPSTTVSDLALRGVEAVDVYRRPGPTVWRALDAGVPFEGAKAKGIQQATTAALTDLQLAKLQATRHVLTSTEAPATIGYHRVLEGAHSCPLCIGAPETYTSEQRMPIHPRCDCAVLPIYAAADPGTLDRPAPAPDQPRIAVHEHGELGPVLTVAGHDFTGPSDLDI